MATPQLVVTNMGRDDYDDVKPLTEEEWGDIQDYSQMVTIYGLIVLVFAMFFIAMGGGL